MRNIKRIKPIIEKLEEIWNIHPDQRFGQLLGNVIGDISSEEKLGDIFFPEDDEWLEYLDNYIKKHKK